MSPTPEEFDEIYRAAGQPETMLLAKLCLRLSAEVADYRLLKQERDELAGGRAADRVHVATRFAELEAKHALLHERFATNYEAYQTAIAEQTRLEKVANELRTLTTNQRDCMSRLGTEKRKAEQRTRAMEIRLATAEEEIRSSVSTETCAEEELYNLRRRLQNLVTEWERV